MKQKITFLLASLLLCCLFLLSPSQVHAQSPSQVHAQNAAIKTDKDNANPPNVYTLGSTITVTITNIPWQGSNLSGEKYSMTVLPKGGDFTGRAVAGVDITTSSGDNLEYFCNTALWNGEEATENAWGSTSCTPELSTGTPFTFVGTINTSELKVDPNSTSDMAYTLQFEGSATCASCFAIKEFIIKAPKQSTSDLQIRRIDDISKNVLLFEAPNSTASEVAQGDKIRIRFMPYIDPSPTYKWGVAGRQENPSGPCIKHSQDNRCYVDYTIPNDVEGSVTIHVMNTQTGVIASAIIKVKPDTAIPTGVETTVAPTLVPTIPPPPTATPLPPPHPPCPDKYITYKEGERLARAGRGEALPTPVGTFVGCGKIFTGLGVEFETSPTGFVKTLFTFLLSISGIILLALIIFSGFQMMTSQGDPEKIKAARERITSGIVGFAFLVFSLVMLEVLGVDILRIPGFCRDDDTACQEVTNSEPSPSPEPEQDVNGSVPIRRPGSRL